MAKKMLIDATHPEETRVVVVDGNRVEEFDFESENKRQLAGNIYLAKVTRVEPSLQAAFVDYGGNRHGFLAFSEIHPDYYQIPVADREALLAEEAEMARAQAEEEEAGDDRRAARGRSRSRRGRGKARGKAAAAEGADARTSSEVLSPEEGAEATAEVAGMDVIDLEAGDLEAGDLEAGDLVSSPEEGLSPAFTAAETPVETPAAAEESEAAPAGEEAGAGGESAEAAPAGEELEGEPVEGEVIEAEAEPIEAEEIEAEAAAEADEDVHEEVRRPRKVRPRKYKIQEVIKVRQILLVQVVKEERGNKGAALTTYLSLAGRYCVLMPNTARGGGISRKITNAADRKKLKQIANEIEVPEGAGLIIRTAGAKRTKTEIKRDYEYLQRLWEQIRELTLKSIAPAKIYEEGNLIKRSIRDLYNREIDEVLVEGEAGYRTAKDFMKMIMPSHAKNVKLYKEPLPLFSRYQVEGYLASMFNPTVQLKSGGYIVIGVTEALVAIDVNSGRSTKEGSIEDTALKTNLEAAEEIARQLRLRDLAGLIVIDFIDMEERKNNAAVEKRFKEKLKSDRARIQVGRISSFGLLEMSRQRLRPGMLEATTQPCPHCHGTGLIRSADSLALSILRQLEEEGTRKRTREVLVRAPVAIVNYLMNQKREHVAGIEAAYGLSVRIEADPHLIPPEFSIEKFRTASRPVPEAAKPVVSVDAALMADIDSADEAAPEEEAAAAAPETAPEEQGGRKKRRRRRRRRSGGSGAGQAEPQQQSAEGRAEADAEAEAKPSEAAPEAGDAAPGAASEAAPEADAASEAGGAKKRKVSRRRKRSAKPAEAEAPGSAEAEAEAPAADAGVPAEGEAPAEAATAEAKPKPARRRRSRAASRKVEAAPAEPGEAAGAAEASQAPSAETGAAAAGDGDAADGAEADAGEAPAKPARKRRARKAKPAASDTEAAPAAAPVPAEAGAGAVNGASEVAPDADAAPSPAEPRPEAPSEMASQGQAQAEQEKDKPRKRGWWALGR